MNKGSAPKQQQRSGAQGHICCTALSVPHIGRSILLCGSSLQTDVYILICPSRLTVGSPTFWKTRGRYPCQFCFLKEGIGTSPMELFVALSPKCQNDDASTLTR